RKVLPYITALIVAAFLLVGCGSPPATVTATDILEPDEPEATATSTAASGAPETPDPCALPQLETEIQEVHRHMREFDDASILASNMPREQLSDSIADLQRIRRAAEDEDIPACLTNLKRIQVQHMNSVI